MTLWICLLTFLLAAQGSEAAEQAQGLVPAPVQPQVSSMRLRNTARPAVVVLRARIECGQEGVEMMGLEWTLSRQPGESDVLLHHAITCPAGRYRARSLALDLRPVLSDEDDLNDPSPLDHLLQVTLRLCEIIRTPEHESECRPLTSSDLCILPDGAGVLREVPCEP